MRKIISLAGLAAAVTMAGTTVTSLPAASAATGAASPRAACNLNWGTNAKHRGTDATVRTPVKAVRAGQHGCFDRLVIDMGTGPKPSFDARYVRHIIAQGSGRVLRVRGHARILINVRGPAGRHFPANAVNLVNVAGFTTFRQVRGAGSFERITSIGLGVRAKLPFRVFELGSSADGWRIVIDVAH